MTENRPLASRPAAAPLQSHGGRWGDAPIRLGLRLNHAAVLRQAGDGLRPDMARLAEATMRAGADSVVLRVDDQGGLISADDLRRIRDRVRAPLTLELRPDPARLDWLLALEPAAVTLLPPADGDVAAGHDGLARMVDGLGAAGIAVVMLVAPESDQIEAVRAAGVRSVEIDTTRYGEADPQHRGPCSSSCARRPSRRAAWGWASRPGMAWILRPWRQWPPCRICRASPAAGS
ncbi:pyridoxine 5'-phosphate synthase [Tistrella bauzanensis]